MSDRVQSKGYQFGESRRNGKRKHIQTRYRVDVGDSARVEIEGISNGRAAGVETRSSHVTKFLRDWDEAQRAVSDPPITPYTKEMQVGSKKGAPRDPNKLVPCPACEGAGWEDCYLCGGGGKVAARASKSIRI